MLIGQNKLKHTLDSIVYLPNFIILAGEKGSGKQTFTKYLADERGMLFKSVGGGVDGIRALIEDINNVTLPSIYYIRGDETFTIQAQNALLAMAESNLNGIAIIVGVDDYHNLVTPLISRATIFNMDSYTIIELIDYYESTGIRVENKTPLVSCCSTPGMMQEYLDLGFDECYEFAGRVFDNILEVSTPNSFKIANNIGFKDEKDKISVELFLHVYIEVCISYGFYESGRMIEFSLDALREMKHKGVNKRMIFDKWILNIRTLRG